MAVPSRNALLRIEAGCPHAMVEVYF